MKSCKEPCKECPWRKKSAKGWLGGQEPEVFTDIIRSGNFLQKFKKKAPSFSYGDEFLKY